MATVNEVEDAMLTHDDPVVTAQELADVLDCSAQHVHDKMDALLLSDRADTKTAGARARVYWHSERVCAPRLAPEDDPAQSDLRDHEDAPTPAERDVGREPTDETTETGSLYDGDLHALDLAGSGDLLAERREAVRAAYDYLAEQETAKKGDFLCDVRPDHPAGYESERGWWHNVGLDGLGGLADKRDDLRKPSPGSSEWRFVGDDEI